MWQRVIVGSGSLVVALCVAACGRSTDASAPAMSHAAEAVAAAGPKLGTRILAGSSSVDLGATPETLLAVPGFGRLTASCTLKTGRLSARFVLAPNVPSNASIVVTSTPAAAVRGTDTKRSLSAPTGRSGAVAQTWQITPFSSAYFEVATIWVTAQPSPAAFGHQGCVAGAQATATITSR